MYIYIYIYIYLFIYIIYIYSTHIDLCCEGRCAVQPMGLQAALSERVHPITPLKVLCAPKWNDFEFPIIKTTKLLVETRSGTWAKRFYLERLLSSCRAPLKVPCSSSVTAICKFALLMYMSKVCCYVLLSFWRRSPAIEPCNSEELGPSDWRVETENVVHYESQHHSNSYTLNKKTSWNYLGARGTLKRALCADVIRLSSFQSSERRNS